MPELGGPKAYLDLDEIWLAKGDEIWVGLQLIHIPGLHQGQSVHRTLLLEEETQEGAVKLLLN